MSAIINVIGISLYLIIVTFQATAGYNNTERRLYQKLFSDYEKSLRPVLDQNYWNPTVVIATFVLTLVEAVNEKEQTLVAHGYLSLFWPDQFLTWDPADYGGINLLTIPSDNVWLPEVTPANSAQGEGELASQSQGTRVILYNGYVSWTSRVRWEIICGISVKDFPYDEQTCQIIYTGTMYPITVVNFTVSPQVHITNVIITPEWELVKTTASFSTFPSGSGTEHPAMIMELVLKRDPTYFECVVVLPMLLLSVLLIPMFILPVESGEKVSLGVTIMLSYSIFLLMMTDVIPRSGVLPRLVIVILASTCFSGLAVFLNVIIINIHHHSPEIPVPDWLRCLVLNGCGRLFCCMTSHRNRGNEHNAETNKAFDNVDEKDLHLFENQLSNSSDNIMVKYLEYFKAGKVEVDIVDCNKDDWCKIARVLDRLLFWCYTLLVVGSIVVVFALKYALL